MYCQIDSSNNLNTYTKSQNSTKISSGSKYWMVNVNQLVHWFSWCYFHLVGASNQYIQHSLFHPSPTTSIFYADCEFDLFIEFLFNYFLQIILFIFDFLQIPFEFHPRFLDWFYPSLHLCYKKILLRIYFSIWEYLHISYTRVADEAMAT